MLLPCLCVRNVYCDTVIDSITFKNPPKIQSHNSIDTTLLNRMVITATRIKEYSPSKVTLDAKDFSGKYLDLQSALETVSGIAITNTGGFGHYSDVSIRGSSPSQVQVYLDGIPLNGATGSAVDISKIPFSSLQTISIYKSTPPLEVFGDNAGGVIDLTTEARKDATTASAEVGSFGCREGSAMISKTIGPMTHRLSFNYGWADDDYPYTDSIVTLGPSVPTDDSAKKMDNNFYSTFSSTYANIFSINDHTTLTSQFSAIVTNEGIFYLPEAGSNDGNISNSKLSLVESFITSMDSSITTQLTVKGKTENEKFRRFQPFYLGSGRFLHDISQPFIALEGLIKGRFTDYCDLIGFASAGYNGFMYDNLLVPADHLQPRYFRLTGKSGVEADVKVGKYISARVGGIYRYEVDSTNDSMTSLGWSPAEGPRKKGIPADFPNCVIGY